MKLSWTFLKKINWISGFVLIVTPIIALYSVLYEEKVKATIIWSIIYYFWTGLGITGGYHRLWSHRAYKAKWIVRFILMLGGSGAVQGSIRWWCRNHRIHHRFTDTPKDPYNAKEGFFYSHFGWMLIHPEKDLVNKSDYDINDLEADPMVMIQNKYYGAFAIFMGFIFPTLVAGIGWGDWRGGYFFAAVTRLVFVHHATFFVNSLAHSLGDQPFADTHTPRDSVVTAVLTLGEGYHNFHHEFPQDYRNAIKFYQYDPTKWLINMCSIFGLAYDLQTFGDNEIKMGVWQMKKKKVIKEKEKLNHNNEILPLLTWDDIKYEIDTSNRKLIVIDNFVLDVTDFVDDHPGGKIINDYIGQDVTKELTTIHKHSSAAIKLQESKRIGILKNIEES